MGTRALIKPINERGEEICTIYVQYDGYPDGYPLDVAMYIAKRRLVNGIPIGSEFKVMNGMKDLTAQIIALLKAEHTEGVKEFLSDMTKDVEGFSAGTIYIYPPNTKNIGEEYVYYIYPHEDIVGLVKKLIEIDNKLDSLQGGHDVTLDDELDRLYRLRQDIMRKLDVLMNSRPIKIKAIDVYGNRVIYDGTIEGFIRKFSRND